MKKLAIAAAAAAALTAGVAHAYTTGTFSNGFIVPNVIQNGSGDTTAVGILNAGPTQAVYWAFFDQDSNKQADGCFVLTENDFEPFIWSSPRNGTGTLTLPGMVGKRGYLVFAAGTTGSTTGGSASVCSAQAVLSSTAQLAASAFQVRSATNDVAFVPVIDGDLTLTTGTNVAAMNDASVVDAGGLVAGNLTHYMRYFTAGGAKTDIVIWSTGGLKNTTSFPQWPINIYDDKQGRTSGQLVLGFDELNIVDPTKIPAMPAGYVDGFITWSQGAATQNNYTYSVIDAPAFGALQSVINPAR